MVKTAYCLSWNSWQFRWSICTILILESDSIYRNSKEIISMRKYLLPFIVFLLLATPAYAAEQVDVNITIQTILVFVANNAGPLTFTYDAYADFGTPNDIGDIDYDLTVNQGWQVEGQILDGVQNAQTAADWDDATWTLKVNGVTIDESAPVVIDSGVAAVHDIGSVWEVLLTIPWPESVSTPDCTIEMTASAV
jgi:hypothetical protein